MVEGDWVSKGSVSEQVLVIVKAAARFLEQGMAVGAVTRQDPVQLALSVVGLHLTYFATAEVTSALVGQDIFSESLIERRAREVVRQVRLLCTR